MVVPLIAKKGRTSAVEGYKSGSCSICIAWGKSTKLGILCGGVKRKSTWRSLLGMFYAYLSTIIPGL